MNTTSTFKSLLHQLNELLVRERQAAISLKMNELEELRKEKVAVVIAIRENTTALDNELLVLLDEIKKNNDRNRKVLQFGLKMIERIQDNAFRSLALTYAPKGRLQIGGGSRVFERSA